MNTKRKLGYKHYEEVITDSYNYKEYQDDHLIVWRNAAIRNCDILSATFDEKMRGELLTIKWWNLSTTLINENADLFMQTVSEAAIEKISLLAGKGK